MSEDDELTALSDAFIDADDHKDAVHNVARCLKIVADKIVEEKRRTGRFCFCFFSINTICFTDSLYNNVNDQNNCFIFIMQTYFGFLFFFGNP